ncbi:hypothetical protein D5086_018257 [Populus alba]|uniref:Uncharacterized protein n=1 Tax=Populus alba TaxID=43335 RepID=A0ACC4BP89_POPAL
MASYWPARSKPGVSHANQAKAWLACLLKRRALREAGFTEQRLPSSLGSGRITGWCHSDSYGLMGWADADQAQEAGSIQCPRGVPSQVVSLVEALEGGAGGWFHIASPLLAVVEYLAVIKQVHMVRAA